MNIEIPQDEISALVNALYRAQDSILAEQKSIRKLRPSHPSKLANQAQADAIHNLLDQLDFLR